MGKATKLIQFLGAYHISMPLYNFGNHFYNTQQSDEQLNQKLKEKYASNYRKWALITGGSDGIGNEFSQQLANAGFNIAITGRT